MNYNISQTSHSYNNVMYPITFVAFPAEIDAFIVFTSFVVSFAHCGDVSAHSDISTWGGGLGGDVVGR